MRPQPYHSLAEFAEAWRADLDHERDVWRETLEALDLDPIEIDRVLDMHTAIAQKQMARILEEMRAAIQYDTIGRRPGAIVH